MPRSERQSSRAHPVVAICDDAATQVLFEPAGIEPDPFVVQRLVSRGRVPDEIVTLFGAAPTRPPSYPTELPHLAGRPVWTTESPTGAVAVGARWLCDDPDAVVAALGSDCQDVGWVVTPPPHLGPMPVRAAFRRGLHVRLLIVGPVPGGAVVQLLDVAAGPHSGGSA